jgi:hypothetical protein
MRPVRIPGAVINVGMAPTTARDRSTVDVGAGPAAGVLDPRSDATDGVNLRHEARGACYEV